MYVDYFYFNLIINFALFAVSMIPIVLLFLLFLDWKRKDLW